MCSRVWSWSVKPIIWADVQICSCSATNILKDIFLRLTQSSPTSFHEYSALQMASWDQFELYMNFVSSFHVWKIAFTKFDFFPVYYKLYQN